MVTEETKIEIPDFPEPVLAMGPMPESVKRQQREIYVKALRQARVDFPGDETTQRQVALKRANEVHRVDVETYEEAMALELWQLLKRGDHSGTLHIVTTDGKGLFFDRPRMIASGETVSLSASVSIAEGRR